MIRYSLGETITQLENLWEWIDAEGKLEEATESQIATLHSALHYLRKVKNITSEED